MKFIGLSKGLKLFQGGTHKGRDYTVSEWRSLIVMEGG